MCELVHEILFPSFGNRNIRTVKHYYTAFPVVFPYKPDVYQVRFVR